MKSIEELQQMLFSEINDCLYAVDPAIELDYYNEVMGDVSFLLAGVLELNLKTSCENWDADKWIDDSLLTKVSVDGNKVSIWGVMIWGRMHTTEQWTDPFYFEAILNDISIEYTFMFGEEQALEVTYGAFNQDRNMWDRGFYSNRDWKPSERNWEFIINSRNEANKKHKSCSS